MYGGTDLESQLLHRLRQEEGLAQEVETSLDDSAGTSQPVSKEENRKLLTRALMMPSRTHT